MLAACAGLSALVPAAADLLPPLGSRLEERQVLRPPGVPEDDVLERSGAVIGAVRFHRVNVFDPSIDAENTALFRLANTIHVVTRESTVASKLLFHPGDRYDAKLVKETERILRSHDYLRDARIVPIAYHDGIVDVEVTTEDTWTLKPEIKFGRSGGKNSSGIGVEERNIFGTGGHLALKATSDVDRTSRFIEYGDSSFAGTRWQVGALVADNSDGYAQVLDVARPFYSLDTRWAAGIRLRNEKRVDSVYDFGSVVEQFETHEREATAFAGWSAGVAGRWTTRWTGGVTFDERRSGALVSDNPGAVLPPDRRLIYPWIGVELIEDDFRLTRNHDQIGRTEDLRLGWHARIRLGASTRALGSDRNALVFDASASKGVEPGQAQTLLWSAAATGRLGNDGLENTLFSVAARYYLRQTPRRTLFVGLGADRGVDLDVNKQLTLGGDTGLRGYPLRYRTGQGRWLMTIEERAFTDWYPFRMFTVGGAVFYDMGDTWGGNIVPAVPAPTSTNHGILKDVGFGLRLGNSRSALGSVIHIDLAFPINSDPSISKVQLLIEAKQRF
jgi:outer membrane protein assembly factor BamA